jgi:hypothetical protein
VALEQPAISHIGPRKKYADNCNHFLDGFLHRVH